MFTAKELIQRYRHIFGTDYTQDINCQGAWLFTEGSGESVADSSQNSNTGAFKGVGEPAWDGGDVPKAYTPYSIDLDGSNDFIDCGNSASTAVDDYTLIMWLKVTPDDRDWECFWCKETEAGNNSLTVQFTNEPDHHVRAHHTNTITFDTDIVRSELSDGWHNIAITREGSAMISYLDGVYKDNAAQVVNPDAGGTGDCYIGVGRATEFFKGKQAEQALFDRHLDAVEISDIFDNGLTGVVSNPWPINRLNKDVISGYHCFMGGYVDAKRQGYDPLKLPDGTIF